LKALPAWLIGFAVLAGPALAEATLAGRTVTLSTLTYDDPARPLYVGQGETVIVTDAVEFGLDREGVQNGLDVVPVRINIDARRIEFDYSGTDPGLFATADFNGYILTFEVDCTLFTGASIDREFSTLPLAKDALSFSRDTLRINGSGLAYDRKSRFAVDLEVTDCPLR
jgi:hypothetical protein